MLKQWSKNVLQRWIDVYSKLLPKLLIDPESTYDKLEKECIDIVMKMSDLS